MTFNIYPAIDIRNGKCVRLMQGDYNKETIYGDSPLEMAKGFQKQGAGWIHVVDLDGAKEGRLVNQSIIRQMGSELEANVQVGGGIRSEEAVAYYLEHGISRVILGSSAISDPDFVKGMLKKYGEQIAIGIDAKDGFVAVEGWLKTSKVKAVDLGKTLADHGAETFIVTDISRDGMLSGPNIEAITSFAKETGKQVIASGGVTSMNDLDDLMTFGAIGVSGAIIGKALYTEKINLKEALKKAGQLC